MINLFDTYLVKIEEGASIVLELHAQSEKLSIRQDLGVCVPPLQSCAGTTFRLEKSLHLPLVHINNSLLRN